MESGSFGPSPDGQSDRIDERERLLHIYLSDHLAWSEGGVSPAQQNQGNEFGREMRQIAAAIEEDRRRPQAHPPTM